MSNEHDDDEIRESIPCGENGLPIGYHIVETMPGCGVMTWRGVRIDWNDMPGGPLVVSAAWDHAIAREKARRAREGQAIAADKAAAMLSEVIRERDELREKLEKVREIADKQDLIYAHDIAAIIGKDGVP